MSWTKEADWLPYFNALAQLVFWKDDLIKAEKSLDLLIATGRYHLTSPEILLSKREIEISKKGIATAQAKLKDALSRLTQTDKDAWKDKGLGS